MLQNSDLNLPARSCPVWTRAAPQAETQVLTDHTSHGIPVFEIFAMGPALQWKYPHLPPQPYSIDLLGIALFRPPNLLLGHTVLAWVRTLPSQIVDCRCLCLIPLFPILDEWSLLEVSPRPPLPVDTC